MTIQPVMPEETTPRLNSFRAAPNILTLLRICLAPFLVAAILEDRYALSFGLFVAAGLTDALDGTLARILRQRTMLGQYLDPVADKLLLSTLFLVLTHKGLIPARVTVLVFGKGCRNPCGRGHSLCGGRPSRVPSEHLWERANTLVQVAAIAAVLLHQLTTILWVADLRSLSLNLTIVLTVVSGFHYAWVASRRTGATAAGRLVVQNKCAKSNIRVVDASKFI